MAFNLATVKQVVSGDTLLLVGISKGPSPPPEKTVVLSGIQAPRVGGKEFGDESYGWESREALRKAVVGMQVRFRIDNSAHGRDYGTIFLCSPPRNAPDAGIPEDHLALMQIRRGLAKTRGNSAPTQELAECQVEAQGAGIGIWGCDTGASTIRETQWIAGDGPMTSAFVEAHKGQTLPGIVEYVRDGGAYRVFFLGTNSYASLHLTGVLCDGFRFATDGQLAPDPFAIEAKFFAEQRILQRDVDVRIDDHDGSGNVLGALIHPKGQMGLLLLENGFARLNISTIKLVPDPDPMRDAVRAAQTNRLRRWKDWKPSIPEDERSYTALVVEVVSGDCFVVVPVNSASPSDVDENSDHERRLYLASVRSPRMGTRDRPNEPCASDAKEFARQKLIGKRVEARVAYTKDVALTGAAISSGNLASDDAGKMHFVSLVLADGADFGELLVAEGLGRALRSYREEDRADNLETLQCHEEAAVKAQRGVHGLPKETSKRPDIVDLVGPTNAARAERYLTALRSCQSVGVIEHVFGAGRYKIRIPKESIAIAFTLAGIRCPQPSKRQPAREAEPAGNEAADFARFHFLQRNVSVKIDSIDRGGSFLGSMYMGKENIALRLVQRGFAEVVGANPALEEAQEKSKSEKLGIWGENVDAREDAARSYPSAQISVIEDPNRFYLHLGGSQCVDSLQQTIRNFDEKDALKFPQRAPPPCGEAVLAQFSVDNAWYRAKVLSVKNSSAEVFYLDYGNSETVKIDCVRRCPPELHPSKRPGMARLCCFAGVVIPPQGAVAAKTVLDEATNRQYTCSMEGTGVVAPVILTESGSSRSLNEELVLGGCAIVDRRDRASSLSSSLKGAQRCARSAKAGVWGLGFAEPDSEDDLMFPSLARAGRR